MNRKTKVSFAYILVTSVLVHSGTYAQQQNSEIPPMVTTVATPPVVRTVTAPRIPTQITVSTDGKTVIISGSIEAGAATRLKIILDAVPSVQSLSLISPGGRLDEATKIYQTVKDRGLDTYVDQICMSACTMIFLGGRQRSATPQAKIGFHQPYYIAAKSAPNATLVAAMRRFYDEANVRPSFTDRAMQTPSSEMWYPPFDELLAANVVTLRVTGGQSTALFSQFKTRDNFRNVLLRENTFRLLSIKHPDIFDGIIDAAFIAKQEGKNDDEIGNAIRAKLAAGLAPIFSAADDVVFIRYLNLLVGQIKAARDIGFEACYLLSQGQLNIQQNLPEKFWREELAILGAALESKSGAVVVTESMVENSIGKLIEKMTAEESEAFGKPLESSRIDVCNAVIKMYEAIENMPPAERVLVGRYLFAAS